jgi:predicted Rossmann fold flavoprotein
MSKNAADITIIGAGAAGLMAAIWVGRTNAHQSIILLDSARKLGAKILVAGGGRCNVTHDVVDESAYAGSSRNAIKKVLRRFDVPQTVTFFDDIGIRLKREETGKLFPTTDDAHTVLGALLHAAQDTGVQIMNPRRVETVERMSGGFRVSGEWGDVDTGRVILATGGKSLPKSGSDGKGYELAKSLGHTITSRVFPALVPLILPRDHFITSLSGITLQTKLEVQTTSGKNNISFTDSTLCTHFGLSGPSVLDISRYWIDAKLDDADAKLVINWLPEKSTEQLEANLLQLGKKSIGRYMSEQLPDRLARALCIEAGIKLSTSGDSLKREARKSLARTVTAMILPISGDRGFNYAEVTAGGVPLSEIRLETMESRICPNLYFCGEICDVDGRIGGYNFQWTWSSGYVAGISAAKG